MGAILQIPITSKEQKDKIMKAQIFLIEAGVQFDSGFDYDKWIMEWKFDWSLKGAKIVEEE